MTTYRYEKSVRTDHVDGAHIGIVDGARLIGIQFYATRLRTPDSQTYDRGKLVGEKSDADVTREVLAALTMDWQTLVAVHAGLGRLIDSQKPAAPEPKKQARKRKLEVVK